MFKKLLQLKTLLVVCLLAMVGTSNAWAEDVTDVLNQTLIGITGTSYTTFTGKTATSHAVYAGQCAGGNSSIQLRSDSNNSGVVTTTSGGKVKSITVVWQSNTTNGRTLNVYGKNTAYTAATDLYNTSTQGELLGTIVKGTSTSLTIEGDYEYIGFRSNSGAIYLTSVTIVWEVAGGDSTPSSENWVKTALADLTSTDVFVIVGNNGYNYAMSNDNSTSSAPSAVSVTVVDGKITSVVPDRIKWTVSGDATNGYTFYPAGSTDRWLYCTNSNNGVRVGTNDNKTFTVSTGYLKHSGTNRYLGVYNYQDWRCYTSINSNISGQTFGFYKLEEESSSSKASPELAWSASDASAIVGEAFTAPTLTNPNSVKVTYESTNENVATISANGEVSVVAAGETTIKAVFVGDDTYKAQTVSYTLTVTAPALTQINLTKTLVFSIDDNSHLSGTYADNDTKTNLYGKWEGDESATEFKGFKFNQISKQSSFQFKASAGSITFPPIISTYGFDVTYEATQNDVTVFIDGGEGSSTSSTNATLMLKRTTTGAAKITSITLTPKAAPVTVYVGTTKYATLYSDANLMVPEGITVYAVGVNDNALVVNEVAVGEFTIEGGQGYMLKADAADSYTFTATSNAADMMDATGNLLKGTMKATTIIAESGHQLYKLANGENGIGFYLDDNAGATLNNGANKAYLDVPTTSSIRGFALSDAITAIEAIEMKNSVAEGLYDLQGRRVHDVQKGIYVVNGKKLFVK